MRDRRAMISRNLHLPIVEAFLHPEPITRRATTPLPNWWLAPPRVSSFRNRGSVTSVAPLPADTTTTGVRCAPLAGPSSGDQSGTVLDFSYDWNVFLCLFLCAAFHSFLGQLNSSSTVLFCALLLNMFFSYVNWYYSNSTYSPYIFLSDKSSDR